MKKIFSVLIALLLVLTFLPKQEVTAASFSDVPTIHAYYQEIMFLLDKGVIDSSAKYGVNDIVTREEVAVMVSKAVGLDGKQTSTKIKDVPSTISSSGYINSAVNASIIKGYLDGTFKPNALVTRGHMATFISRGFKLTTEANVKFKDVPLGSTSYEHVRKLAFKNITTGYLDGTFKPNENLSRAQISAFLARAMGFIKVEAKQMKVHFINVGQGDSILIQSPNGKNMLIDGGKKSEGDKVVSFIKSKGITKLDYVVATHPDADHIGGLISVLNSISIGTFIDSGKAHTTDTYYEMLQLIDTKNIPFKVPVEGEKIPLDSVLSLQVLNAAVAGDDNNEASLVLKMTYGKEAFLFMGDADVKSDNEMVLKYDMKTTVLKAGHHGSSTSTSQVFVDEVKPDSAILSYEKDNSYGHPVNVKLN